MSLTHSDYSVIYYNLTLFCLSFCCLNSTFEVSQLWYHEVILVASVGNLSNMLLTLDLGKVVPSVCSYSVVVASTLDFGIGLGIMFITR